jgi:hypothetical protein
MKIAAIYARKSTDQNGVADEAKSVTRQIEPRQFTEEDRAVAHVGVIRHIDKGGGARSAAVPFRELRYARLHTWEWTTHASLLRWNEGAQRPGQLYRARVDGACSCPH